MNSDCHGDPPATTEAVATTTANSKSRKGTHSSRHDECLARCQQQSWEIKWQAQWQGHPGHRLKFRGQGPYPGSPGIEGGMGRDSVQGHLENCFRRNQNGHFYGGCETIKWNSLWYESVRERVQWPVHLNCSGQGIDQSGDPLVVAYRQGECYWDCWWRLCLWPLVGDLQQAFKERVHHHVHQQGGQVDHQGWIWRAKEWRRSWEYMF